MNQEDLIHFCKNKFNLEKFSEGSEDEIETISLAELEPKNEIKINLAELVEEYKKQQLHIENK